MKRWIHASRDIEYKIKDYIAAWAKDDVKEGKPMADFREFKEEMKSEGLKADEDGYDYYVACYNNASKKSSKKVKASEEVIEPWNDPEVEYVCNTNGWWCYRKIEDGRGKWYAHEQDTPEETMIPVTYAQVRGYEPMPDESSISKLRRDLGKLLLPPDGYTGAASKLS
jgi:hypothetical protein